jgi:cob(I)alamin adenosyltransferase
MSIYTRTGDKGQTSLFDGTRVPKNHIRVEAYGTVDELNSVIGSAIAHFKPGKSVGVRKELETIQNDLLDIGSALAFPAALPVNYVATRAKEFEKVIDALTATLPELKEFILPGGSQVGAALHVARTIARKAERKIVTLMQNEEIDESIVIYINRLSDLLFTMARHVNFEEKVKEKKWVKK